MDGCLFSGAESEKRSAGAGSGDEVEEKRKRTDWFYLRKDQKNPQNIETGKESGKKKEYG